ncbi:IQ calmodulin-binding motif protein [Xylariomycetidae sp. FL0641]|nr:IQ calmodulin-binding motif protein [Xylariomycetidae sp. FL0641]
MSTGDGVADSTESPYKINENISKWCYNPDSVSALVAKDPKLAAGEAWKKLFGHHETHTKSDIRDIGKHHMEPEDLRRAKLCGKWGKQEPSQLFLRMYHDALCTLDKDPCLGVTSPSLMGSSGVVPLTVLSVIPDIARHMSNLIVRAEKEVFLASNYWQSSVASKYITNGLRELSRRAGARGERVTVKILYDRGSPRQLIEPHYVVPESEYTGKAVALPSPEEIPNLDLQVMNFHQPVLGTFHAKYMVVDRRIGIVQSNNIMDNENMEMMVQVEGPIVDGLYDMALLSWHKAMHPPLPCLKSPAAEAENDGVVSFDENWAKMFTSKGTMPGHSVVIDPGKMPERPAYGVAAAHTNDELGRRDSGLAMDDGAAARAQQPQGKPPQQQAAVAGVPIAHCDEALHEPGRKADAVPASDLPEHTADAPHYDSDIAGEVLRAQASVTPRAAGQTHAQAVRRHLNHTLNEGFGASDPDPAPACAPEDEMTPFVPHPAHAPVPMALVNRPPYGPVNHRSVGTPQNAAWLSALRNARKNVFIQSPTVNAEPLIPAIREACERGVDVYCYVCLGYNDAGELLPMQGGHNEMVAKKLYTSLSSAGRQRLHWHWYVGKDQARPLAKAAKRRSCHVKLLIADERVGVVGSGNQDTQSWFHSQEVNVMLDSPAVCRAWADALRRNQNTHLYGAVGRADGVWRDHEGKQVEGAMGADPGRFSWATGVVGAIKRLQGKGGF